MREIYTPEINITFAQDREDSKWEGRDERKKTAKRCPGFINAIKGYTKKPTVQREMRMNRIIKGPAWGEEK